MRRSSNIIGLAQFDKCRFRVYLLSERKYGSQQHARSPHRSLLPLLMITSWKWIMTEMFELYTHRDKRFREDPLSVFRSTIETKRSNWIWNQARPLDPWGLGFRNLIIVCCNVVNTSINTVYCRRREKFTLIFDIRDSTRFSWHSCLLSLVHSSSCRLLGEGTEWEGPRHRRARECDRRSRDVCIDQKSDISRSKVKSISKKKVKLTCTCRYWAPNEVRRRDMWCRLAPSVSNSRFNFITPNNKS